jgi:hypothetical protein
VRTCTNSILSSGISLASLLACILTLACTNALAQDIGQPPSETTADTAQTQRLFPKPQADTLPRGPRRDRPPVETNPTATSFFQSPTSKLFRSVLFPGWGQWSNGKKQKAAIYFTIETYFLTRALIWRHRAGDRLRVWESSIDPDQGCNTSECLQAFNNYDSARSRRNYFYWLTGATIFVSMFDAYADAYLLSLERTRNKGDEYWGGHASLYPDDEFRVLASIKF